MVQKNDFDLQDRFIDYAVRIINVANALKSDKVGNHIKSQLLRSGTAPASNYGEAQGAESRQDFIHKLKIALKELRETEVWLKILVRSSLLAKEKLEPLLNETDELISILYKSIDTAKKNIGKK
ncbi:MAG TPA: four helix bundle protein [Caldithrix abyssi]|uniref:Four helix bundle protein n=1 Tax=Caldithrix abyssi TaxID=187145 RepID=A0A7V4U0N3_CALAY|nr:four helix bundle protein [Caldithrix abyssi]